MKNEIVLINQYLNQYIDLYGENLYLPSIAEGKDESINVLKGGEKFTAFYHLLNQCVDCGLIQQIHQYGFGKAGSKIIFITEFDRFMNHSSNYPLNLESGELFGKILFSIGLTIDDIYMINLSKSNMCKLHLIKFLTILNAKLNVVLGKKLGDKILNIKNSMNVNNRNIYNFEDLNFMVTYHPDEIILNPDFKKDTWIDFKYIRDKVLD